MYPPRFDYLAPTTVEEVVAALGEHERGKGDGRRPEPHPGAEAPRRLVDTVVDINRVAGLDGIEERRHAPGSARSSGTRTPSGRRS